MLETIVCEVSINSAVLELVVAIEGHKNKPSQNQVAEVRALPLKSMTPTLGNISIKRVSGQDAVFSSDHSGFQDV